MSQNDGNVSVHTAHFNRQSSLPTYEEAMGIAQITDYTEVILEIPELPTENQQYIINIHNNYHEDSQTTHILDIDDLSRNGDVDRLIQENHIIAADSLSQISLETHRTERIMKQKNELKSIMYCLGAFTLFGIFIMILGMTSLSK